MEKIRVASLFCGCGGMDLGVIGGFDFLGDFYEKNPFEIVYSVDNDSYCTKIYNDNFDHECIVKDVRDIDIKEIPEFDMLIGGFPCQSFSISAQNPPRLGYKDDRGMLFFEMVRIIKERQPRFFIAENVKGLLSANKGQAFPMIISEFKSAGYFVVHKLLNASEYGVPQKRERVIIVGFRNEDDYLNFKYPTKVGQAKRKVLRDVIIESANCDESLFFSEKAVAGMMAVREKMNKGRAMRLEEPCNTISAHLAKVSLNSTDPVFMVGERYRRFSSREAANIQSFPNDFKLDSVSQIRQYKAIGNAVPPVLMWHIAQELKNSMFHNASKSERHSTYTDLDTSSEGKWIQLSLFEAHSIYLSRKDTKLLIGSCRQSAIQWINSNLLYNYPITEEGMKEHNELLLINRIIILHRKTLVGYYNVVEINVVTKEHLAELGYPTSSSRHKANTKYLLYTLEGNGEPLPDVNLEDCNCITGKGIRSKV